VTVCDVRFAPLPIKTIHHFEFSTGSKWLETLKQVAPGVMRVAIVFTSTDARPLTSIVFSRALSRLLRRWTDRWRGPHRASMTRSVLRPG
jgi:hypothetical protein